MSNVTREVLRTALKNKPKWFPTDIAFGDRTQANWKSQTKGQNVTDPLEIINGLIEMEDGDIILDYICNKAGGYFIGSEEITERSKCLHSQVAKVFKAMSNSVSTVVESAEDHIITDKERAAIEKSFNEFMKVGQQLLNEVDKGMWQ